MDQSIDTHYMTREFLETQLAAFKESIEKKDAMIISLQDRNSNYSQTVHKNQVQVTKLQEYLVENYDDLELHADEIAKIFAIELTREVTYDVTITARVTVAVPVGEDAEEILNDNLYVDANYGDIQVDSYEIYNIDEI